MATGTHRHQLADGDQEATTPSPTTTKDTTTTRGMSKSMNQNGQQNQMNSPPSTPPEPAPEGNPGTSPPTKAPVKPILDPGNNSNNDVQEECTKATSCKECKRAAVTVSDNTTDLTCRWQANQEDNKLDQGNGLCRTVKENDASNVRLEEMCKNPEQLQSAPSPDDTKTTTTPPTKAPVQIQKLSTQPPTKAPIKEPTPPPVTPQPTTKGPKKATSEPTKTPVKETTTSQQSCEEADSCSKCINIADSQESGKTCQWQANNDSDEKQCMLVNKDDDTLSPENMCPSRTATPLEVPFGAKEMIGITAFVIFLALCRRCCRSGAASVGVEPSKYTRNSPSTSMFRPQKQPEARYQGVATVDPGETGTSNDWDWNDNDDDGGETGHSAAGDIEIPRVSASASFKLKPSAKSNLFSQQAAPNNSAGNHSRKPATVVTAAPLSTSTTLSSRTVTKPTTKPTQNDFFSDMGLAAKPTFNKPRKLGAVPLAKDSSDDWGNDDDLNDLLDD
ncbi:hypothetical protein ACA910_014581 [Epithemia clementina (nom. ined.)]